VTEIARDRLTWLTYAQLGTYGYFIYGFGPTVPLLRDEQDVSRTVSGLHGTALAVGSLLSALVIPAAVRRYGRGPVMWGGMAGLCAGIVCYTASDALELTMLGAFLGGYFGSMVVVPTAAVLSDHHGAAGPSAISEANAIAAGVGTVAPLMIGLAVALGAGWRWGMLGLLPVVALIGVVGRGQRLPPPPERVGDEPTAGRRLPRRFWIGWATVTAFIAVEFSLTLWTADILRDRFGLGSAAASAGVFTIVGGMCLGRVVGARLALRLDVGRLLQLALAVCGTGFAVFWVTTSTPLALVALLVVGLGISVLYPLGIARAIELSEGQPDKATARGGLGAGLAAAGGPFVLGALADRVGIHGAFLVVPALLAFAAVGVRLCAPRVTVDAGGRSR
jgi:predicted MFS family arabinose efflux permease